MTVFRHAVASFDPAPDGVLLWTRLSGATTAEWEVSPEPGFGRVVAKGSDTTGPERDFTITVDVTGLQPGTTYWYRFASGGERSPVGRTRTLPEGDAATFTIGLVSCARYSVAPLTVYRALALCEVDLVVHLGDYMYDDPGEKSPRRHDPPGHTVALDDYRRRLAQVRQDADCRALHLRHPVAFVWDDHDFADNAWLGGAKDHDPEKHGPWPARRAAAVQAHLEWVPWRREPEWETLRIYRAFRIGNLADLLLVDSRMVGRERQASLPGGKPVDDPTRSLLGRRQWAWLEQRLADEPAGWAVVANGVVFSPIPLWVPAARLVNPLLPGGYIAHGGTQVLRDDQWDGYPAERDRLLEVLGRRPDHTGTVLISGDVHSSWAFDGARAEGGPKAVEMTVPSVSSTPLGRSRPPGLWEMVDRTVNRMEHVRWVDVTSHGFSTLTLTADEATAAWWFVDPFDDRDTPRSELAKAFRCRREALPMRWERLDGYPLPEGDDLSRELPARPDDIGRMHRWHLRRQARAAAMIGAAGSALAAAGGWLFGRRKR